MNFVADRIILSKLFIRTGKVQVSLTGLQILSHTFEPLFILTILNLRRVSSRGIEASLA